MFLMSCTKLDIILGPMFSGKTTKLLEIAENLDSQMIKYIIIKPDIDNRYLDEINQSSNTFVISHNLKKKECLSSNNLDLILKDLDSDHLDYILIDEAQFFPNLYHFVIACLEKKRINIVLFGLDGDYLRKPMGEILNLVPIANSIVKLKSSCNFCKEDAIFTHRICSDTKQVLIGGIEKYIPLCRNHYIMENNLNTSSDYL